MHKEGHNMKKVGIIGASGKIGLMSAKALEGSCCIKGGSRNYSDSFKGIENFEWQQVDIYDDDSLDKFCDGCDIILNCTGPAGIVKERVAVAAGKMGIPYVDTADVILVDKSIRDALPQNSVYVAGGGYVPGLGGLLIKYISDKLFDRVDKVKCYQVGKQCFSSIAFTDIVLTSFCGTGKGDSYFRNGRILQEHNLGEIYKKFPKTEKETKIKAFLSDEMIDISAKCNIRELHWFNGVTDERLSDLVMKSVSHLIKDGKDNPMDIIGKYAKEYEQNTSSYEEEWSTVIIEVRGLKDDIRKEYRISYNVEKEEEACGMIASLAVRRLLNCCVENGTYRPADIVSSDDIRQMINDPLFGEFTIEEI